MDTLRSGRHHFQQNLRQCCRLGNHRVVASPHFIISPTCRLRLDGREVQEGVCDILELSSEGVTIAMRQARAGRRGQQGALLIGPAGGDHYALPVAVRWVKPATTTTTVLGLSFPTTERWTYNRG